MKVTDARSLTLADFPKAFSGEILTPGDKGFPEARLIFNMRWVDHSPAFIAKAKTVDDVACLMRFASERGVPVAIRSGGHDADGSAMPDGALVLDLTAFHDWEVDPETRRIKLGAGFLLGEMDALSQKYGLVVPAGTVSHTGVAGLTLGGGVGNMMRRYGATVDSLVGCDIVTVDGRVIKANAEENPDLFWALRGGGGNFGVVTAFEYIGHPLPNEVFGGEIVFPLERSKPIMQRLREQIRDLPRELSLIGVYTHCPPIPVIPAEYHGQNIFLLLAIYSGDHALKDEVFAKLIGEEKPIANLVRPMPWTAANSILDAVAPYGRCIHTRGGYFSDCDDDLLDIVEEHARAMPRIASAAPGSAQNIWFMGGAISEDFAEDSAAFSREGARFFWECVGQWDDHKDDERVSGWVNGVGDALLPHIRSNGYINLTTNRGPEWLKGIHGSPEKHARLLAAKRKWDPGNILRYNKNLTPD